jgi:hypothetical protein
MLVTSSLTMFRKTYALPVDQTHWEVPGGSNATFTWDYDDGRDRILKLYEKGKTKQWDASERLDWSVDVDPDNPLGFPPDYIRLYVSAKIWNKLDAKERANVRRHLDAWRFSQFLHGEQGALIGTAKLVQSVPDLDAKLYAATQVMDEGRHVEVYSRYIREKLQLAYPINPHLKILLNQALSDSRWDLTYLAVQVVIEGLALALFSSMSELMSEPLACALNAYVMQDEARHVAFGRLALRDLYPQLSEKERDEREEFCVEACYLMRDRFLAEEVWHNVGFPVDECMKYFKASPFMREYHRRLFSRIVPTLQDIGICGPRMRAALEDMGGFQMAHVDMDELLKQDEDIAEEFDRLKAARGAEVARVAAIGADETK